MRHPNWNLLFGKCRNTWGSRAEQYLNSLQQILWEDNFDHYILIFDIFRKDLKNIILIDCLVFSFNVFTFIEVLQYFIYSCICQNVSSM